MRDAPRGPAPAWTIPAAAIAVGAAFYAFHLWSEWWLDRHPLGMGALRTRHFLPLIARPGRAISLWLLPALGVMAVFFVSLRALFLRRAVKAWLLLPIAMAFFFAIGTSVAMIDGIITAYAQRPQPAVVYPYTQPFASYADVPRVEEKGPANFLRNFSRRHLNDLMANHTRTHPPGPTLFLWAARNTLGRGLTRAWLATVLFSALGTIPVFLMGRDLYGEEVARRGLALYLLVPSVVLFTTTSMDGAMTVFLVTTIWAFLRATAPDARWWPLGAVLSGLAMALASFMTYTVTFLCLFFGVIAVLAFFTDRPRFWRILRLVPVAFLTVVAFYGALYAAVDYDPIAAARRAGSSSSAVLATLTASPAPPARAGA